MRGWSISNCVSASRRALDGVGFVHETINGPKNPCCKSGRRRKMWPVQTVRGKPMRVLFSLAFLAAVVAPAAQAQDSRAAFDKQASEALRDVHDRGAELYNAGDAAAGYRMYQGGLIVV